MKLNIVHAHKARALLLFVCALFIFTVAEAQISYTATFDTAMLTTTTETVNGTTYTHLHYPDMYVNGDVGTPETPTRILQFSVPYNATLFRVTVNGQASTAQILPNQLYPIQPPVPSNLSSVNQTFIPPDSAVYSNIQYVPAPSVPIVNEGFYDGDNHIISVAISPMKYNTATRELTFYTSMIVKVTYATQTEDTPVKATGILGAKPKAISRPLISQRLAGRAQVKQIVVNPNQVDGFAPKAVRAMPRTVVNLPAYEYCVITSRELAPAFDRLIGWKNQKGYIAGVVCIEDILADPDMQMGDEISDINDDAGKLRAYLRYAYYGDGITKYVLLAGKEGVMPIRYGYATYLWYTEFIPTDLYFSDLNGNWNGNGNNRYGEYNDGVDIYPELYVGRLLCKSKQEVYNYTEKLLRYERNPGNGDYSYLKKALYTQSDGMQNLKQVNRLASECESIFPSYTIMEENPSYNDPLPTSPTGKQVIDEMNNHYGFFSWHGHGSPAGICVKSSKDNKSPVYSLSALSDRGSEYYHVWEEGGGLNDLTNFNHPAIAYSMSCTITPFDLCTYDGTLYDIKYNVGESFTVGSLAGGPALLGNTREGWVTPSFNLERNFITQIKQGKYCLGIAEAHSKISNTDHWINLAHNLIGCPEFEMWTNIPSKCVAGVRRTDNAISVIGQSLAGWKVAISSNHVGLPEIVTATGKSVVFNNARPNSTVTIYKHNGIPYIAPLYLQNMQQRYSQYIHAEKVFIGNNVDANRTAGDYIVVAGANFTIEASDDITIQQGFIVQSGATVTLKCKGTVSITGGEIQSGGKLFIEANATEIRRGFDVKKGAIFEIKKQN